MRILSSLQTSVMQRPFSYTGRHYQCVSLLWRFRLGTETGRTYRALPRGEHARGIISSSSQFPRPASFEGMDWRPRQRYAGTHDEASLRKTSCTGANLDNTILRDWRPLNG